MKIFLKTTVFKKQYFCKRSFFFDVFETKRFFLSGNDPSQDTCDFSNYNFQNQTISLSFKNSDGKVFNYFRKPSLLPYQIREVQFKTKTNIFKSISEFY